MQQYWAGDPDTYDFVGVSQLAKAFQESGIGFEMDGAASDLEKGRKPKQGAGSEEEDSSEDGGKGGHKKKDALDPLVHKKYARNYILLCMYFFPFSFCV